MLAAMESLYRRPLPAQLIAFASPEGRALFDAARAAGGMEATPRPSRPSAGSAPWSSRSTPPRVYR